MGYFGDKKQITLIEEPKKKQINILDEYKNVQSGYVPQNDTVIVMMRWFSNHKNNILSMQSVNKYFKYADKRTVARMLSLNIDRNIKFIKLPKKTKEENELSFLIPYIQRYYGWSDREYKLNEKFINFEDEEMYKELDRLYAFEPNEARKLGISRKRTKIKYSGVPEVRGFFA